MVTNLDASNYPSIRVPITPHNGLPYLGPLLFDRILCDVPCSGDGTIRKNVGIWKKWNAMDGNGPPPPPPTSPPRPAKPTHCPTRLQLRILQRAMRMLRRVGKILDSPSSLY